MNSLPHKLFLKPVRWIYTDVYAIHIFFVNKTQAYILK